MVFPRWSCAKEAGLQALNLALTLTIASPPPPPAHACTVWHYLCTAPSQPALWGLQGATSIYPALHFRKRMLPNALRSVKMLE